jgi:hypothetical protein
MSVYTTNADELCCPLCGDSNTHVDRVVFAARPSGEDGPIVEIAIGADGDVIRGGSTAPSGTQVGIGRRHRIALIGWCEFCDGKFSLVFTQHKGVTLVESVDMGVLPNAAQPGAA